MLVPFLVFNSSDLNYWKTIGDAQGWRNHVDTFFFSEKHFLIATINAGKTWLYCHNIWLSEIYSVT